MHARQATMLQSLAHMTLEYWSVYLPPKYMELTSTTIYSIAPCRSDPENKAVDNLASSFQIPVHRPLKLQRRLIGREQLSAQQ